jgi:hypothetical protein
VYAKIFAVYVLFIRSGINGVCMDPRVIALLVICIAALSFAGCTTPSAGPAGTLSSLQTTPAIPASPVSTVPASLLQTPPPATISPVSPAMVAECTRAEDCVPAGCCHPSSCTAVIAKQPCNLMCTASCEGPLDCGAGSCGCVKGTCSVVPASPAVSVTAPSALTSITIKASPLKYSPVMSSTPGIGLEPVASGFNAGNATFAWKTSYGHFLSWDSPDFTVNQLGDSATNHGGKLYWSFIDPPASTATPVTITVTATDPASGRLVGSSTVTLAWEGNFSVVVRD